MGMQQWEVQHEIGKELNAARERIRRQEDALRAADVLAHNYPYTPAHERYWAARGHENCFVCNGANHDLKA